MPSNSEGIQTRPKNEPFQLLEKSFTLGYVQMGINLLSPCPIKYWYILFLYLSVVFDFSFGFLVFSLSRWLVRHMSFIFYVFVNVQTPFSQF